jgi:hypothetical protein
LNASTQRYIDTLIDAQHTLLSAAPRLASLPAECIGVLAYGGARLLAATLQSDAVALFALLSACDDAAQRIAAVDDDDDDDERRAAFERTAVNCAVAVSALIGTALSTPATTTSVAATHLRDACRRSALPLRVVVTLQRVGASIDARERRRLLLLELWEALALLCDAFAADIDELLRRHVFVALIDVCSRDDV